MPCLGGPGPQNFRPVQCRHVADKLCDAAGGAGSGAGLGSGQLSVSNPQTNPACSPIPSLQSALGLQQDPNSMHYQAINASVLVAFLIFLRFCVYVALRKKTARV